MHLPSLRTALLPLLLTTLAAAQGSWSDRYDRPGVVGRVFAVGHDGPHLVVGGKTLQADGQFMNRVARWDGSSWSGYGDGVSGDVRAIAEYQGQLVVAGEFYAANGAATGGASVVHSIARWDGTRWQPLGGGLELSWSSAATVWDLEVFQGQLYAAGDFDLADGLPAKGIARWDGTQWQAVGGGVDKASSPKVLDMTVSTAGQLVVAGEFTHAGGQPRMNVAAWDGGAWTTLGAGLGTSLSSVFALEEFQGSIYAGGNFTSSGGAATAKVARWDGTTWQPLGTGIPDWAISSTIYSLQSFGGALYVGGNFDQAGGVLTRAVARWNGAQWSGVGGVGGTDIATTAIAMTEWNQQLVVGGEFEYAGTTLAAGQVTVSTSVATFDGAAWGQVGGGLGFDNEVYDAVHYAGGIAAVGRFTMAGSALTSQVAFFDGTDWRFIGLLGNGNAGDAFVWQGDLVITGDFTSVNGQDIRYCARWDGSQWHAMGQASGGAEHVVWQGDLYAGGYDLRKWNGTAWEVVPGATIGGSIYSLLAHDDGKLYIGGSFNGAGPNVASWDGTSLQSVGGGLPYRVESLVSFEGDVVAGLRTDWQAGVAPVIQRFDGTSWAPMATYMNGSLCMTMTVFRGELYAGGDLILFSGDPRDWIAKWNGTDWVALGSGLDGTPWFLLADDAAGSLFAGGWFFEAGGMPSWNFAEWVADGAGPVTAYCFGDGSGAACPCGNEASAGQGCANSSGVGARVSATGSLGVSADTLAFSAANLLPNQPALLFQGENQVNGGDGLPFGDGLRCAGGDVRRLGVRVPSAQGEASWGPGLAATGQWTAGATRRFQVWYRDPSPSAPCSTGFNLTNGLSVTFAP